MNEQIVRILFVNTNLLGYLFFMNARVARSLIDDWVNENGPDGLLKLAKRSGVSSSTWTKARLGVVPKRVRTRRKMYEALKVQEAELFVPVGAGEEQAS